MKRNLLFGIFAFGLAFMSNCKKADDNPNVFVNVDDEFYINLFEEIDGNERVFQITVESIQEQDCKNYTIDGEVRVYHQNNQIILSINDIVEPDNCIEGNATAYKVIPVVDINPEVYLFKINLKGAVKNDGKLTINQDEYLLEMNSDDGFNLLNNRLYKIPENTIWGYVGYELEDEKAEAENYIKELDNIATNLDNLPEYNQGYYGYFSIIQDRNVEIHQELTDSFFSPFVFSFEDDQSKITDLIGTFCSEHPGLNIHVFNTQGEDLTCP